MKKLRRVLGPNKIIKKIQRSERDSNARDKKWRQTAGDDWRKGFFLENENEAQRQRWAREREKTKSSNTPCRPHVVRTKTILFLRGGGKNTCVQRDTKTQKEITTAKTRPSTAECL